MIIKSLIQKTLNNLGYEIRTIPMKQEPSFYLNFYPEDSIKLKRFYNIGAGGFQHPYWTNVDYDNEWYAKHREKTLRGIQYDLFSLTPLPIESESAEVVYSSHTVEHINNTAAQNMFDEAFRILKPNGHLRITTPNIDLEYRAFNENDRHYFYWIDLYSNPQEWKRVNYNKPLSEASIEQIFLTHFASSVSTLHNDGAPNRIDDDELNTLFGKLHYEDALDYCISKCPLEIQKKYPGNHMNWWNFNKMSSMLNKAGFTKVYLSAHGQSYCPILRDTTLFDNTHPKISLYVEAIK